MAEIKSFELYSVDLPFKKPFKHAAYERSSSDSLFVKCVTGDGTIGFGESLPRRYVTGESRESAFQLLKDNILPQLIGKKFDSFDQLKNFLSDCDGKTPAQYRIPSGEPQAAAWCAVELSLLDSFGKVFNRSIFPSKNFDNEKSLRYSGVLSTDCGLKLFKTLLKFKLYGIKSVKVKVQRDVDLNVFAQTRRILGKNTDIRVDVNMAWEKNEVIENMNNIARFNINSFEQPLAANQLNASAELVKKTGYNIMADESLGDALSLMEIIDKKAFNSVNVRVSKCGGFIAASNRCTKADEEGLMIQIGSQVGESSLLSAANLALILSVPQVKYAEGCFGLHLLKEDPCQPLMQFGFGGRFPKPPDGYGIGVNIDETILKRWTKKHNPIQ